MWGCNDYIINTEHGMPSLLRKAHPQGKADSNTILRSKKYFVRLFLEYSDVICVIDDSNNNDEPNRVKLCTSLIAFG